MNIDKEDKEEFIARMRGLAFTEDISYEEKAMSILDELLENSSNDIQNVSESVDTRIDFSYRDENGEIQHNNVSTKTAQTLLRRWQEQEIKVNRFIKDYHKTN